MNINILDVFDEFECDLDVKFVVCINCCLRNGALRFWYHSSEGWPLKQYVMITCTAHCHSNDNMTIRCTTQVRERSRKLFLL